MNLSKQISSLQNSLVKKVMLLKEKSRERKKTGLFILEGQRELSLASKAGYSIETLLFNPDVISEEEVVSLLYGAQEQTELIEVSDVVYQKIAYRGSTEGVLAISKS